MSDADALVLAALRDPGADAVRRRVLRQLLSSMLYEGALAHSEGDGGRCVVHGTDADGAAVRYEAGIRRAVGFDRVRVDDPVVRVGPDGARDEVRSVPRFLDEVRASILDGAHPGDLARFAREVEETRVKDALAEYVRVRRGDAPAGVVSGVPRGSSAALRAAVSGVPRGSSAALRAKEHETLEGTITDGHRYHPAYKSRIGFDLDDDLAFGPEFLPSLHPVWLAAHRSIAEVTTSASLGAVPPAPVPVPDDHVALPVHPWQWREVIRRAFADELADGRLVVLGPDPASFAPQQSIRTLSCRDDPARHHLKTALSITNTSTARGLAPHTVRNAAPITDWLDRIVARDPYLRAAGTIVLGEVAGVSVVPGPGRRLRPDVEGTLAAIWRRPLAPALAPGERAVPVTGLTATEIDGTPLVAPWLAAHGARAWVAALVDAVALPLVHLLVHHGVALESHAQNMSLVHVDGWPRRVALKDFHDGVRFSRRLLAHPGDAPVLDPPPAHHTNANSFVETDDPALVRDFLLDAYFFVNLGELALFLDEHDLLGEDEFWTVVAARVRAHQDTHGSGAFDLFTPTLAVEKLTTRRLTPDTDLALHPVGNPLHRFDPARRRG